MNRGQLKQKVRDESHRDDLATMLDSFIDDAVQVNNRRFGLELTLGAADTAENLITNSFYLLYFYIAMRRVNEYTKDFEQAVHYDTLWLKEANRQNITNREANDWVNPTLYVKNEVEVALDGT